MKPIARYQNKAAVLARTLQRYPQFLYLPPESATANAQGLGGFRQVAVRRLRGGQDRGLFSLLERLDRLHHGFPFDQGTALGNRRRQVL